MSSCRRVADRILGVTLLTAGLIAFGTSVARAAWWPDPQYCNLFCNSYFYPTFLSARSDGRDGIWTAWSDGRGASFTHKAWVQRVVPPGVLGPGFPPEAIPVCDQPSIQTETVLAADAYGALVAWNDNRSGEADIYVQRVLWNGTIAPGWPTGGVLVSANGAPDQAPQIASDGMGGATVVWTRDVTAADLDVVAAHVDSNGTVVGPVTIAGGPGQQTRAAIVASSAYLSGYMAVAYQDNAGGNFNIRMRTLNAALGTGWGTVDVCTAAGDQTGVRIISDGVQVLTIAWDDLRGGLPAVYVIVTSAFYWSVPSTPWLIDGVAVAPTANTSTLTSLVADGVNGAVLGWEQQSGVNRAVYVQRFMSSGSPAVGWPLGGRAVSAVGADQREIVLSPDGGGGAIAVWRDNRNGQHDIFAQRLTAGGAVAMNWPVDGLLVCGAYYLQSSPVVVPDAQGNAIAAWVDQRLGPNTGSVVVGMLVDRFGALGDPEPAITSVKDIASDQGGKVKLTWSRSYLDADPRYGIANYWVWREVPASVAAEAVAAGGRWLDQSETGEAIARGPADAASLVGRRLFTTTTAGAQAFAWEFVGSQPASAFDNYSFVTTTMRDSLPGSNPRTFFMVQARNANGAFWNSAPDSGYSVDNLAPAAPAPLTGRYSGGATRLHWNPNVEADLAEYRIYRGTSSSFTPDPLSLVAAKPDTGYVDGGAVGHYYKLSAVDVHGNESPFALLQPSGTVDVADAVGPAVVWLAPPTPNPARGPATVRFGLPVAGDVALGVFDVQGRCVKWLARGPLAAGVHTVRWGGESESGTQAPNGVLFVRLQAGGRTLVERLARVR